MDAPSRDDSPAAIGSRARSRTWVWTLVALALVACVGFSAGFVLASSRSDSGGPQPSPESDSPSVPPAVARAQEWSAGLAHGLSVGSREGARRGAARGEATGKATALAAMTKGVEAERSESPRDVGYEGSAAPALAGSGGALVVGDSLEVLSSPYLKRYLPNSVPLTINVEGGYSSLQIFDLFQEAYDPSQSVIVFDAGTNDNPHYPEILAGRLKAVADIIGNRCMVVPTIHGLVVDGLDSSAKNHVVRSFAASRPGTQVPDWAAFVAAHPDLMQPDNLHPIAEGAAARARLIAQGIKGCLAYG